MKFRDLISKPLDPLFVALRGKPIEVDNRTKFNSPFEARRVAGVIFGEMSSPGSEEEARQILSTIVNRAKQKGVSLQTTIREPKQYKAFGGQQYQNYLSGKLDYPSQKKAEIVKKVISELEGGRFSPTTEKTGFKHLQGRILLDKDFGKK